MKQENLALIRKLLDSEQIFFPNGADVHYWARKLSDRDYILYLGNMERLKSANPLVGLKLPDGEYSVKVCSSLEGTRSTIAIHGGTIHGKSEFKANSLKRFNVDLGPGEMKLLRVQSK
jgi:hypothetical protein